MRLQPLTQHNTYGHTHGYRHEHLRACVVAASNQHLRLWLQELGIVGAGRSLRILRFFRIVRTLRVFRLYRAFHKHYADATTQVLNLIVSMGIGIVSIATTHSASGAYGGPLGGPRL